MPSAVVQSRSAQGSGASISLAFSSNVTAGNTAIVAIAPYSAAASSTTSSPANTFTSDAAVSAGNGGRVAIYSAPNVASGATTVTGNATGSNFITIAIYEVSGLITSSIKDQSASNSGTSASHPTGTTPTTTQANEFLFAAVQDDSAGTGPPTVGGSWTLGQHQDNSANPVIATAYQTVSATGAYSATFTWNNALFGAAIATYKEAGGGGGSTTGAGVGLASAEAYGAGTSVLGVKGTG
jgi:hypothetical protein